MAAKKAVKTGERMKLKIQALSKGLAELACELEEFTNEEVSEADVHNVFVDQAMSKLMSGIGELEGSIDRPLRLKKVLEILPIKKSKWWDGVKSGRYPKPDYILGPKLPTWRTSLIQQLVNGGGSHEK